MFVESVLRYGLPVNFVCALIKPGRGADKKLHELLHVRCVAQPIVRLQAAGGAAVVVISRGVVVCRFWPVRVGVQQAYGHLGGEALEGAADDGNAKRGAALGLGSDADFHPYVYLPLNLPAGQTK